MTLDEFIKKYDGQNIDFDGSFGAQCVDLYRQYVKEVLGFPQSPPVEGAKDIWNTYLPEYFGRIENTPTGVPEKGDIVIFGEKIGKYGHVSIFVEGDTRRFVSFDQNYPLGTPCHLQGHTYNAVIGWLTPLKKSMEIPSWFKTLLAEKGLSLEREGEFRSFWEKAIKYDDEMRALREQVQSANEALADRAREVSMLTEKNQKLEDKAKEKEDLYNTTKQERDNFEWEKNKLQLEVERLQDEILKLQREKEFLEGKTDDLSWFDLLKMATEKLVKSGGGKNDSRK